MPVQKGVGERDADHSFNVWLRDKKVSFGEVGLNPRGVIFLPRNMLHNLQTNIRKHAGQRMNSAVCTTAGLLRLLALIVAVQKRNRLTWNYPVFSPEAVFRRCGLPIIRINRHPKYLVESVFVNVGDLQQNAKASIPRCLL
jgi:hypothetical protein